MAIRCESCSQLITDYDDDIYVSFHGAEYRFCCEQCARDWMAEHQDELNDYLYNDSGMFQYEVAPKEKPI